MKIPFYKPSVGPEEINEVVETLKSGWLTTGPRTKQFELEFAKYLHQKHAVALNSCTAALHLALESVGLKAGEAVLVPTMTFAATAEVVRYLGGRPILVDCRADDFNLDVADAEKRIQVCLAAEQPVVAIMPVHYGGQIGDVAGVRMLARRHGLKIIEDAAHCCPAYYKPAATDQNSGTGELPSDVNGQPAVANDLLDGWLPVGASADISCYSFYANKTITTGEGGMACTNNEQYAERMRIMSLHGISRDAWKRYTAEGSWYYEIIEPGYKYNLTDVASAIGIHQLRKSDLLHRRRTEIAHLYHEHLNGVQELILPTQHPDRIHSWHLYVIRLKLALLTIDRAQFMHELQQCGIGTSVHWMPLHMHPYYRETYGYKTDDLPVASKLFPEVVSLPIYPTMSEADVKYVCDSIKRILLSGRRFNPLTTPAFQQAS